MAYTPESEGRSPEPPSKPFDWQLRPSGQLPASTGESLPGADPADIHHSVLAGGEEVPARGIGRAAQEDGVAHDKSEIESPEEKTAELIVVAGDFLKALDGAPADDISGMGYRYSPAQLNEESELVTGVSEPTGSSMWHLRAVTTAQKPAEIVYRLTTDSPAVGSPTIYEWGMSGPMIVREVARNDHSTTLSERTASPDEINRQIVALKTKTGAIKR